MDFLTRPDPIWSAGRPDSWTSLWKPWYPCRFHFYVYKCTNVIAPAVAGEYGNI